MDTKRGKAIIGLAMAAVMVVALMAMVPTAVGKPVTDNQTITSYGQSFIVNYDNVTIWLDGEASSVVVGQDIVFKDKNGNLVGTVTLTGVEGTDTEGEVVYSDDTGRLETEGLVTGPYNATATATGAIESSRWEGIREDKCEHDHRRQCNNKYNRLEFGNLHYIYQNEREVCTWIGRVE